MAININIVRLYILPSLILISRVVSPAVSCSWIVDCGCGCDGFGLWSNVVHCDCGLWIGIGNVDLRFAICDLDLDLTFNF